MGTILVVAMGYGEERPHITGNSVEYNYDTLNIFMKWRKYIIYY